MTLTTVNTSPWPPERWCWSGGRGILLNKKYVLSNLESVQCNFFIFDNVTFIQFKICCCVHNVMKIGWFFTEIWRYNDFQMATVHHLGIVLPPYKTTHEVSVAGHSCLSNFVSVWYTDLKLFEFFAYLARHLLLQSHYNVTLAATVSLQLDTCC